MPFRQLPIRDEAPAQAKGSQDPLVNHCSGLADRQRPAHDLAHSLQLPRRETAPVAKAAGSSLQLLRTEPPKVLLVP